MALPHQSIATINSPQFINLQPLDINPLMSSCEIKVLYIGENRNRSYISKDVAAEMAKTLRGAPIVGYYKENKQDFADHGQQMIIDDEGIHFNSLTRPYGFVAPDAKVWFQKFEDKDQFGNSIEREYLMTTGYLWTGQYEQAKTALETGGRPQSMELDEETLQGRWAPNNKNNLEFFIINDAIFTKLCILGEDVEPCFEGASVTTPEVSRNFSKSVDDNFKRTLFQMINELRDALKGGKEMAEEKNLSVEEEEVTTTFSQSEEAASTSVESELESSSTDFTASEEVAESQAENSESNFELSEESAETAEASSVEFEKKEEQEEDKQEEKEDSEDMPEDDEEQDDEDDKKKYSLLEQQYNELSTQYEALKADYQKLVDFKNNIENKEKDNLIYKEFYMLSDQDKADVIAHKTEYTLDEIKSKLAVICFEKKVNFNSESSDEIDDNKEIITYSYNDNEKFANLPDWVKAVKELQNRN